MSKMDDLLGQLSHDNVEFDSQWETIQYQMTHRCDSSHFSSVLNGLADFVLQEPPIPYPSEHKFELITVVCCEADYRAQKKIDLSIFDHAFQAFNRVLDLGRIDLWHLTFLEEIYRHFGLEEHLHSKLSFVEQLLSSLQKHSFTPPLGDENSSRSWIMFWLNDILKRSLVNETTLTTMRSNFQQLCRLGHFLTNEFTGVVFRFAVRNSITSPFWADMQRHIVERLPTLFDSYTNSSDAQMDLELCCIFQTENYFECIRRSFSKNLALFQQHFTQILITVECLILKHVKTGEFFFSDTILEHFSTIPDIEPVLHMFIRISEQITVENREEFASKIMRYLCRELCNMKTNRRFSSLFFDLGIAVLKLHTPTAATSADHLLSKQSFHPWKELGPRVAILIHLCATYENVMEQGESCSSDLNHLQRILENIYGQAKVNNNLFEDTHSAALTYTLRWASSPEENQHKLPIHVYRMGISMINLIDRKQITLDIYSQLLDKIYGYVQSNVGDNDDEDENEEAEKSFFEYLAEHLVIYMKVLITFSQSIHTTFNSILLGSFDRPMVNKDGSVPFTRQLINLLWSNIAKTLITEEDARIYEPSLAKLYATTKNETSETKTRIDLWLIFWLEVKQRCPQTTEKQIEIFLVEFIEHKQLNFIVLLQDLYSHRPELYHQRIDQMLAYLFQDDSNSNYREMLFSLLQTISNHHPEVIFTNHINSIFTMYSTIKCQLNDAELHGLFQFLTPVASVKPDLFDRHEQQLISIATETPNTSVIRCLQQYFISSTIVNGETVASHHLDKLISLLKLQDSTRQVNRSLILHACQLIGIRYKEVLETKRSQFVILDCSELVHLIDHHKLTEENKQALEQFRQEIEMMEHKLQTTEVNVQQAISTIKQQQLNITTINTHVNILNTRLEDVTERVDSHQKEIERIDGKTLGYVPRWANDVCRLLNRRTSNDWRLLGRRFGYSSSELRHWAIQFDPCMALLNEWYMTHKADEATFGLVKMLKEIGREDVEDIIRKAVTDAGETIPEMLEDIDIHRLPPIFISYHWNSQAIVLQLKGRLEEAGYLCWMDVGQMGGGQELHVKVDKSIRGAKVFLCCMNEEYAASDICVGQGNLALNTGKPFIPLQMEKQGWPPAGALGPLMTDYLFIRFFDRKAKNDPHFWPDERFIELLGQIRYHAAPDPEMISERYRNWFVPREEHLIFLKESQENNGGAKKSQDTAKPSLVNIPLVVSHPQVMISYQWDHQGDIIDLYKRLTQFGYRVWLDIFQMGGGDSLFAKIDAGIRSAQCIIACVTSKYTSSVNCRREMSLADALGKPIIPLLLEQLSENWPPAGPMSLVFADKVYVDFRSHQKNDLWRDKEYDQVLVQLKQYVPEVQTENPKRHLLDMERPSSSVRVNITTRASTSTPTVKRVTSAPVIQRSQACSIM